MSESMHIILGNPKAYDEAVHCGTAQARSVTIITKDHAMQSGAGGAVISFIAEIDGKMVKVQATVTMKLMLGALMGLSGRYNLEGELLPHHESDGSENEQRH